jgi:hypothetical protein
VAIQGVIFSISGKTDTAETAKIELDNLGEL